MTKEERLTQILAALPATKPELAQKLGVTHGHAVNTINRLVKLKLVEPWGHRETAGGRLVQIYIRKEAV